MQKTMEVLKKKCIIEKIQNVFSEHKPPKGTPEEVFENAIESALCHEMDNSEAFEDEFFEAMLSDAVQLIRNELKIEFFEESDFLSSILPKDLVEMIEKSGADVQVHVVHINGNKKGQGEKNGNK